MWLTLIAWSNHHAKGQVTHNDALPSGAYLLTVTRNVLFH
jgi:hypothetical protein